MNQTRNQMNDLINRAYLRYLSLDSHPSFSKLNINNIIKPSNIALFITAILTIIALIISPLGIPFLVVCFIIPARDTLKAFRDWDDHQWIVMYWLWNAFMEVLTPLITLFIPHCIWILLRIGIAYYLVVMQGAKTLSPTIRQYLNIKSDGLKTEEAVKIETKTQ